MTIATLTGDNGTIGKAGEAKFKTELSSVAEEYELYLTERFSKDRNFEEGALYAGKNALIYDSVQEEGNIYTVLKNSSKKYVDSFEVIKGELIFSSQSKQELDWAQEIGIKVSPYLIIDGELMSSEQNLYLMDEATGTITIPENVTKIGDGAFRDVAGLRSIVIPSTVKEIGNYAFSGNPTLENVVIEEGVETIGEYAFAKCSNLKKIEFPQSVTEIKRYAMVSCTSLDNVELPPNITILRAGTFEGCTNLKNIKLPEKLEIIDTFAFAYNLVEKIEIPDTVTAIFGSSFVNCNQLTEIVLSENSIYKYENGILMKKYGTDIYFISDNVLKNTTTFYIPEGAKSFNIYISRYNNIKKLVIPESLTYIMVEVLPISIEEIEVNPNNGSYIVKNKCLYTKDGKTIMACFSKEKDIIINEGAETLNGYAFSMTSNAENIKLPESLKTIDSCALSNLGKCKKINIGKNVEDISPICSLYNYNVTVTVDETNPYYKVNNNILYSKNGEKLISVLSKIEGEFILDNSVKEIGDNSFYQQDQMKSITIHSNVDTIGDYAFIRCSNLKEIKIDKSKLPDGSDPIIGAPWRCPYGLRAVFWKE